MASHVPYLEIVLKKQLDFEIAHYAQVRSFVETSKWGRFKYKLFAQREFVCWQVQFLFVYLSNSTYFQGCQLSPEPGTKIVFLRY